MTASDAPRSVDPVRPTRREVLQRSASSSLALAIAGASLSGGRAGFAQDAPAAPATRSPNERIRVAFVGVGSRGSHLMRSHGLWPDEELAEAGYETPPQALLPNVELATVCDVFQRHLDTSARTGAKYGMAPRTHRDWRRVIDDKDIDAVVIATPDVWHGPIAIAAMQAGKHVYVEKCMTQTVAEAKELRRLVKGSKQVLLVGHQNRHSSYHEIAARLVRDGVLGKITVVEGSCSRNSPEGAYAPHVPKDATPETISWDLFQPPRPSGEPLPDFRPSDLFGWRRFWRYGTGIAGDLLSHEIDSLNQIVGLGIPDRVSASGGVYVWKDGRETPDVYSVIHEHEDPGLTFTYNASLACSYDRKMLLLGRDATMVLGLELMVYVDALSRRYAPDLQAGRLRPNIPFIHFQGPMKDPKLRTSPTLAWAEGKGLTFTDVGGKVFDTSRLHVESFYRSIREGAEPACGVDQGFDVAIACHMGTESYRRGRPVRWDRAKEEIVEG